MSGDNAFFPEMQALRKKKKHSIISEPRSADNFSPVLEEFEEDQEKKTKKIKHIVLPNDFHEFSNKFQPKKPTKKQLSEQQNQTFLNKSSSLGSLILDKVDEDRNEEEKKKRTLFHHYDTVKDNVEEKSLHKKPSYIETSESPIREMNEEGKEELKKRLTPRGKAMLFQVNNVKCDELDNEKRFGSEKVLEEMEEVIMEEKEENFVEKSGKKVKSKMQEDRDYMKKIALSEEGGERIRESSNKEDSEQNTIQESDEKVEAEI